MNFTWSMAGPGRPWHIQTPPKWLGEIFLHEFITRAGGSLHVFESYKGILLLNIYILLYYLQNELQNPKSTPVPKREKNQPVGNMPTISTQYTLWAMTHSGGRQVLASLCTWHSSWAAPTIHPTSCWDRQSKAVVWGWLLVILMRDLLLAQLHTAVV